MILKLATRMVREVDNRLLWKFAWSCGVRGVRAVRRFDRSVRAGSPVPAFVFISITDRCNLACQGCWVSRDSGRQLSIEQLDDIICQSKKMGVGFFGILGGEPLLHEGLLELLGRHRDSYFQLFTNGTLLNLETTKELRRLGNVTPLISVEGLQKASDIRRGGDDVYERTMQGLENCRKSHLITGVATSVCQSNYDDLVHENFVNELIKRKVHYLWYYIYRPVGAHPEPQLCLSKEQIINLRHFMVEQRCKSPIAIVDAYWNHLGEALCPAVTGISHHINPAGDVEPCPPIQFASDNFLRTPQLEKMLKDSVMLKAFREEIPKHTHGCVLMDCPEKLVEFIDKHAPYDSSGRDGFFSELRNMQPCAGHHQVGEEIPEKHWAYRFAKKHWFFGFGAYG